MEVSEEIDGLLKEIESRYPHSDMTQDDEELEVQLYTLSEEFDSLGLQPLKLKQPFLNLLQQLINNAFALIQMQRKTLSNVTEINIFHRSKEIINDELQKNILTLKKELALRKEQIEKLERKLSKLNLEQEELNKKISRHNKEMERMKQYFHSKEHLMTHRINNLENENHHLKEICCKDFDKYFSKEEKFLRILKSYKHKEETYKNTLQKLENNNMEILNEILNLKTELALAYLKKEDG